MEKDSGDLSCLMTGTRWGDVEKEHSEILSSGHPLEAGGVDVLYLFPFPESPRNRRLGEVYWLNHQWSCYNKETLKYNASRIWLKPTILFHILVQFGPGLGRQADSMNSSFFCLIALSPPGVSPLFMWLKLTHQHHIVGPARRKGERKLRTHNFLLSKMVKLLIYHLYSHVLGENLLMWSYLLAEKWDSIRTIIHWRGIWRPFLLWASVLSKDTKKNLRSYLLQESLLTIRKERTGGKELDTPENTWGKNRENTSRERWVTPRDLKGWITELLRQVVCTLRGCHWLIAFIDCCRLYTKTFYCACPS